MSDSAREWQKISDLLDQAFELDEDDRAAYVKQQCAGQPELEEKVLALLDADSKAGTYLGDTAAEHAAGLVLDDQSTSKRFGAFQTDQLLAYGGMGVVYSAHRADGEFDQKVAIKSLRLVVNDSHTQQRFRRERQILAQLQHHNIAHILDGGVDEQGHPWFAMEFVDGVPVNRYCEQQQLTLAQRLRLFLDICSAVAYAHSRLVVHRDLKPANILVTTAPTPGQKGHAARVMLLDFGVAKFLGDEADANTDFDDDAEPRSSAETEFDSQPSQRQAPQAFLTPAYAAPEQVLGQPITVATDVYTLGLLLYELVCGKKAQDVDAGDTGKMADVICQQVPAHPSSQASGKRRRDLKGALDAIIMKALAKKPLARYQSVADLVDDLERYRGSMPVLAYRRDAAYRIGRFVRRYRWAVASVAVITLLLAGIAFTSIRSNIQIRDSLEKARLETAKANEISSFLHQLFELADPFSPAGKQVPVNELLSRGREQIFNKLQNQPETRQAMILELAVVHNSLGQYEEAMALLDEALVIQHTLHGNSHADIARTLHWQSIVADNLGDYVLAEEKAEAALAMRLLWLDVGSAEVGESKDRLASLLAWGGQKDRALALSREAVATLDQAVGADDERSQTARHNLAWMLGTRGFYDEALPVYEQVIEIASRTSGPEHPQTLETLNNFAVMLRHMGQAERAEQIYRQVLEARLRLLGEEHPQVAYSQNNLAKLLQQEGQLGEAGQLYEASLATFRKVHGSQHSNVAVSLSNTAQVYLKTGQWALAEAYFREALAIHRAVTPPGSAKVASTLVGLGHLLTLRDQLQEAKPLLEEALVIQQGALDPGHWQIAETQLRLGQLWGHLQQTAEARALLTSAQLTLLDHFGEDHPLTLEAQQALSELR